MSQLVQLAREIHERCGLPAADAPTPVHTYAVIGAGTMGRGIATICLPLGRVLLVDPDDEARRAAAEHIARELRREVRAGALTRRGMKRRLRRLQVADTWPADRTAELVIEAAPEKLELKRELLAKYQARLAPGGVWATNTSALSLADIAAAAPRPERVIGMHYLLPVERSRLVELVVTARTSDEALATARTCAVLQQKAVLVARDSPGFFTTRVLSAYLAEGLLLLGEGWSVGAIDAAAERFGFAVGPFELLDRIGLETAVRVAERLTFKDEYAGTPAPLQRLLEAGCRGAASGAGFYRYGRGERPLAPNPLLGPGAVPQPHDVQAMMHRLALAVVSEAARALHKRVVATAADANVGAVLAVGFPPATGGPLRYARRPDVLARMHALATLHGPRFRPAAGLEPARLPA